MITEMLEVCCPYCSCRFETGRSKRKDFAGKVIALPDPVEIEFFQYTRDIGRFDPKPDADLLSPDGWSRVGEDYLSVKKSKSLNFARIGVLRERDDLNMEVWYRVQSCLCCHRLFEIYANYTPHADFTEIWPHLFAVEPADPHQIRRYKGISWPVWLSRNIARLLYLPNRPEFGPALIGVLLFLLGLLPFLPWLLTIPMPLNYYQDIIGQGLITQIMRDPTIAGHALSSSQTAGLIMAHKDARWVFGLNMIVNGVAAGGIIFVLFFFERFFHKLQTGNEFFNLFKVRELRGVNFWYNYTLCRFVGVQDRKFPQISQVEIIGSGLALLSLLVVWVAAHIHQWYGILISIGMVLALILSVSGVRKVLKNRSFHYHLLFLLLLAGGAVALIFNLGPHPWGIFYSVIEIVFWSVFAYVIGVAAWTSMNSALYILKGLTRVPMKLSPYDDFKQVTPLLDIQRFSTNMMATLFVTLIGLVSLFILFPQYLGDKYWMTYWLQVAVAVLFAVMAIGVRPWFFIFALLHVGVVILINSDAQFLNPILFAAKIQNFTTTLGMSQAAIQKILIFLNPRTTIPLLDLGVFLTLVMYFNLNESRMAVKEIVNNEKTNVLNDIDAQIANLRDFAARQSQEGFNSKDKNEIFEYTQALHGLDSLMNLRKTLAGVEFRTTRFTLRVFSPLITSLLLPTIWDKFIVPIFSNLGNTIIH